MFWIIMEFSSFSEMILSDKIYRTRVADTYCNDEEDVNIMVYHLVDTYKFVCRDVYNNTPVIIYVRNIDKCWSMPDDTVIQLHGTGTIDYPGKNVRAARVSIMSFSGSLYDIIEPGTNPNLYRIENCYISD